MSKDEKIKEMLERIETACGMYQCLLLQALREAI